MRLFRRRDDHWTLAQGVVDGHPTIVRTKQTKRDRSRPVRVTIKVGITHPDEHGFPRPDEMDDLSVIEETLVEELSEQRAELVLVVTANGAREFVAYSSSDEWLEAWAPSVVARWGKQRPGTGIEAAAEPDWATYRAFAVR